MALTAYVDTRRGMMRIAGLNTGTRCLVAVVGASAMAFALVTTPNAAQAKPLPTVPAGVEKIFNSTHTGEMRFVFGKKTRPNNITLPLPSSWKNKRVKVYWRWQGPREVTGGTLRWTENHPHVVSQPGADLYAFLYGGFSARFDTTPALSMAAPYREIIYDCWSIVVVVVDGKGNTFHRVVTPTPQEGFKTRKANSLVDVSVSTR